MSILVEFPIIEFSAAYRFIFIFYFVNDFTCHYKPEREKNRIVIENRIISDLKTTKKKSASSILFIRFHSSASFESSLHRGKLFGLCVCVRWYVRAHCGDGEKVTHLNNIKFTLNWNSTKRWMLLIFCIRIHLNAAADYSSGLTKKERE